MLEDDSPQYIPGFQNARPSMGRPVEGPRPEVVIDASIRQLLLNLQDKRVKPSVLLARLAAMDYNKDGRLHVNDLEEVLVEYLGPENISRRQIVQLARCLLPRNATDVSIIDYTKLGTLLQAGKQEMDKQREYIQQQEEAELWNDRDYIPNLRADHKRGSLGDWLQNAACPAEIKNFRRFIQVLEEYERISGMKCVPQENGFTVPLGPELKANISFFMNDI